MTAAHQLSDDAGTPLVSPAHTGWWRHLFVESEDAQIICDRSGAIREVNRRAAKVLALGSGSNVLSGGLLIGASAAKLRDLVARDTGPTETLSTVGLNCPSGVCLVADLQVTPFDQGCSLIAIKDATRRLRLETHTQRLLAAIDSTPDVVLLTDAEFRITFVNPAFENATGHTIEDSLGRALDFFQPAGEAAKTRDYKQAVANGFDWVGEVLIARQDGSTYPVEMTVSAIHDRNAQLTGVVALQRDVSAKKKLQDELLLERNFVRSIVNSLDGALYTIDGRLRITHFNDGWQKLPPEHGWLRLNGAPEPGKPLLDYVTDGTKRAELEKAFRLVLAEGRPQELQGMDSKGRHWTMTVFPWHHEGKIRGLIYKVTDNSAFMNIQNQLFEAQKLQTLGALAAGVAHDFNNLLLAIRGNVGLLLMDPALPENSRIRLEQADQAAARASNLSQQLLSFSRTSDEKVSVLDFNLVLKEAAEFAKRILRGRTTLELKPAPGPVTVSMDATRATQVLLNLCVNAHDAMPQGGTLTISNEVVTLDEAQAVKVRRPAGTEFLRCRVTDTGTGIPPEVLPRIFNPFFTTKEKGKGTGLGLSIVHGAVTGAGGFIEIESKVGVGTTFHIYLPLDHGPVTAPGDTEFRARLRRGTGRVLVVDDLDLVLEFAASFLKQAGYEVLTATSADAALKLLSEETEPVNLLFTDYTMPGQNGWQLIQTARERWPKMRCLLASGYIDDTERTEMAQCAGLRILNKPYDISEATKAIAEVLQEPLQQA